MLLYLVARYLVTFVIVLRSFCALLLLKLCLVFLAPCCSLPCYTLLMCLTLFASHLVILASMPYCLHCFATHATLLFVPYYFCCLVVCTLLLLKFHLATLPLLPYRHTLLLTFFKYLLEPPPPHCCFATLLLIVAPCCPTLSVGTPS